MWHMQQKSIFQDLGRCHTKRTIGGQGLANPSFGITPTTDLYSLLFTDYMVKSVPRCHTKRRVGGAPPANPSFGMTTTKILKYMFLLHAPKMWILLSEVGNSEASSHQRKIEYSVEFDCLGSCQILMDCLASSGPTVWPTCILLLRFDLKNLGLV